MHGAVCKHQADLGNVDHSVDTRSGLTGRVVFIWSGYGLLLYLLWQNKTPLAAGPEFIGPDGRRRSNDVIQRTSSTRIMAEDGVDSQFVLRSPQGAFSSGERA
jgi:hypothetical protein